MTDIYKINSALPLSTKIELLNDMILAVNGKVEAGKFDLNELNQLFTESYSYDRKFIRNLALGNTLVTYTGWTHLYADSGYSIWKYTPANYVYNALNRLYFDNKIIENRGEAFSEALTGFDKVFLYGNESGSDYTDLSTEAAIEVGTEFEVIAETDDYLYVGLDAKFSGIEFTWQTVGSNYTLVVEYWNGAWTPLSSTVDNLEDTTLGLISDGVISFDQPADWVSTTVNAVASKFWIRISTTTTPVVIAKAYKITPANNVISLLALSNEEFQTEQWAWCSYIGDIYVTIRNNGVTAYEGNAYITSASSATNKQNFFVYNHQFVLDYEDVTYNSGSVVLDETAIVCDTSIGDGTFELTINADRTFSIPTNPTRNKTIIIKVTSLSSSNTLTLPTTAGGFRFGTDIETIGVTAENTTDYIGCKYDETDEYWDVIAYTQGFSL